MTIGEPKAKTTSRTTSGSDITSPGGGSAATSRMTPATT